jgi:hypothetical protein
MQLARQDMRDAKTQGYDILPDDPKATGEGVRDWRGIKALIGDRVFYVTVDGTHKPKIHEAWVEEVDEARILVRPTASAVGEAIDNGGKIRWLHQPQEFVVVKGQGFV